MEHHRVQAERPTSCVYLVRHGETAWSLSGRHTGRTDIALTGHGEDQARALRPMLATVSFDRVFVSPAGRARQTCMLAGLGDMAEEEPDLAEWDYGAYEGRRSIEIRAERSGWSVYRDGCPEGEGPAEVTLRADRLIARLRALGGSIALFSHGQIGSSLTVRWIGLPVIEGQHFVLGTAAVGVLGSNPGHADLPVISAWNLSASR
ncbi:histidine phosphatase family protein (plasmid) [Lichenicola cladoniae]|uniref:Histidine phosphatase family protein n=1 Tax=Lichenicola cladoniae TaxID=1484109 RepID=A0A6M8HY95_9PROT|nr:histidine phosphatase family protein [Lichenicola cladoniae]NPD66770.1 histidine phosphatase family protein [Acetobacteraceae bacterium]QKE93529.1 histidine phosphatase family protein [Lichenicola cladoniae]